MFFATTSLKKYARVVTINSAKQLFVGLMVLIMLAFTASADRLEFSDVEVKVAGEKSDNLDDGDSINDEAKPGDKISVKVEVQSNFTNSDEDSDGDEIAIEDIEITVTLEGVDDGDDLEEEIDSFDLDPGDDDGGNVDFEIPIEVGEGNYDIVIEVEGEDTNGTTHTLRMTLDLEVEKENHEVRISRALLSPEALKCSRSSQLAVTVLNTGAEDEEDVSLTITNPELGIDFKDTFDIDEGEFDDDMEYSKGFSFTVPKDVDSGVYPISIRAVYDDGGESVTESVDLTVSDCDSESSASDEEANDEEQTKAPAKTETKTDATVVVANPSTSTSAGTTSAEIISPITVTPAVSSQESVFDSKGFMAAVIAIEILIVVVGISLVVYLLRR